MNDPRRPSLAGGPFVVFSYGTLQQAEVQRALYGELLPSWPEPR